MGLDENICQLPLIGNTFKRLFAYFKEHIAFTDFIHISLGLGIGFLIAGKDLFSLGIIFLAISLVGHIYAFAKGKP